MARYMGMRPLSERRRDAVALGEDMTVKVTRYQTRVLTSVGESTVDVPFPIMFTQEPWFSFGFVMDDNQPVTAGEYPFGAATVTRWIKEREIEGAFEGYYTGCTLVFSVSGPADARVWMHCTFDGKALRNPLASAGDVDAPT